LTTKIKIMKFGGTSLGDATAIRRVYDIVSEDATPEKVVVVSAPSGVTAALLAAAEDAAAYGPVAAAIDSLARELELDAGVVADLLAGLRRDLSRELAPAEKAALVSSYGERLAAVLLAAYFTRRRMNAVAVDARDFVITDGTFPAARYDEAATCPKVKAAFADFFRTNTLPVVTGYIGRDGEGRTTTLGRGGSDLTATLLGHCLAADVVEIWSDADGIMSADPRLVARAKLLRRVSYDEAVELSNFGARIVFNRALGPAMQSQTPVRVRNTFNPSSPGTLITGDAAATNFSVTSKSDVTVITVANPEMVDAVGYLARLFKVFADFRLSVDVVAVSEASVSVTVSDLAPAPRAELVAALGALGAAAVKTRRGIVTTISRYLDNSQGIFPKIFQALTAKDIDVEMISYGNREINLTLIVEGGREEEAVKLIHELFVENYYGGAD